ncbi:MAG: hypothetical protein IKP11_04740 [Paludibacteraceae bacterium]|nr:hypothetical protein [Paludibacteraceae bacterium]
MSNQNLTISRDNALKAYKSADKSQKYLLELLFGADTFKQSQDVRERIKTFEDACNELGEEHPFVLLYNVFDEEIASQSMHDSDKDVVIYLKLRIITAALNEGWEPQFTEDEYRYYPWFALFTQKEIDKMSDDDKSRVVGRANSNSNASGGLAYANAYNASSYSNGFIGSRLAFSTRELADYAGRQFVELYADFVFPEKA